MRIIPGFAQIADKLQKLRAKEKKKNYKPFTRLYLCLFLLSIAFIAISFFIQEANRWFTIVAGFGCSGIASVIVAWLIERANCYNKEKTNTGMLDNFFERFDLEVKLALSILLEGYAKRKEDIDIDRNYTLHELHDLINNADKDLGIWSWYYKKTGEAFSEIDASPLLFDPTPQHNLLHSYIRMAAENYSAYKDMEEKLDKKSMGFFAHVFLCGDLNCIESIYTLRNKEILVSVREESKEFIRSYRKSIAQNKNGFEAEEGVVES